MSPLRVALAAVLVVVLGAALAGVGMGGPPGGGEKPAPTGAALAASKGRIASGGATVQEGRHEFSEEHCATCHALAATGADGRLGPRMDTQEDDARTIAHNIADPRADIAEGFEAKLMPTDYAKRMTPRQIHAVAAFIHAASGEGKGDGDPS